MRDDAHPKIMIVDDDATNRMVLQMMVEDFGYQPLVAASGHDAIAQSETVRPQLILMDLSMPEMGGIEAATEIRRRNPSTGIPIIAVTAHDTRKHRDACETAGFDGFLPKPVDMVHLRSLLEQHVAAA